MLAVAGLAFREGVRRRILWAVPLAMAAIVLLVLLADPSDERQAISQAVRAALFASGLMAIVVPLILGCAAFPREIESRVIFSIVTKPVTRLELIVGKITGLAGLVAVVLTAMGVFSMIVLFLLQARLVDSVDARLASGTADEKRRPYLQYVVDQGLLGLDGPNGAKDLQIYAFPPDIAHDDTGDTPRYFSPSDYFALVPFRFDEALLDRVLAALEQEQAVDVRVLLRLDWQLLPGRLPPGSLPVGVQSLDSLPPTVPPVVGIDLRAQNGARIASLESLPNNGTALPADGSQAEWASAGSIALPPEFVRRLLTAASDGRSVDIGVWGYSVDYAFGITRDAVALQFQLGDDDPLMVRPAVGDDGRGAIRLETRFGRGGLGLRAAADRTDTPSPAGVFAFRETPLSDGDDEVGFLAIGDAEISESHLGGLADDAGRVRVRGVTTDGRASPWQIVFLDTGLPAYFDLPEAITANGQFDIQMQSLARGQIVSIAASGLRAADAGGHVWQSLAKALINQWLLGLLVAILAVAFGTFVNWPVALISDDYGHRRSLGGRTDRHQLRRPRCRAADFRVRRRRRLRRRP